VGWLQRSGPVDTSPPQTRLGLIDPNEPLGPDGPATTLQAAIETGPVLVFRPQTPLASDKSIVGVWARADGPPEVFLRYQSGLEVAIRPADFANGFAAFYQGEIDQGYPGELVEIAGVQIFVNAGKEDVSSPAAVLELDGMLIELIGKGDFTRADMLTLAASVIEHRIDLPL
jgi:hypothetical protein